MKKYILTLALGMACAMGFAQNYVIVNQGTTEHKYLLKEVTAISHTTDAVTIEQGEARYTYPVVDVDSITFVDAQEQVMPDNPFDPYMPIYDGDTPPNIEGIYRCNPDELVYSTYGFSPGDVFIDAIFQFYNQDMINNTVDYRGAYVDSNGQTHTDITSLESYVTGSGNNFTVFFNVTTTTYGETEGHNYDVVTKEAYAVSGTVGENGISNLYWGFVMLEKSADPDNMLVPVGTLRVFKDGNGWSELTTWPTVNLQMGNDHNSLPVPTAMPK
jgi:hypothetical protein